MLTYDLPIETKSKNNSLCIVNALNNSIFVHKTVSYKVSNKFFINLYLIKLQGVFDSDNPIVTKSINRAIGLYRLLKQLLI